MSWLTVRFRGWVSGLPALAVLLAFFAGEARGQDAEALIEEAKKADDGGDAKEIAKKLVPLLKKASKELLEEIPLKLGEDYKTAKLSLDWESAGKVARITSILALAGSEAKNVLFFANCRMVIWQDLFDLAGSVTMDVEEKVEEAHKLAKMWEPMWEDLFKAVMSAHGQAEAKGDTATMKQYLEQLEIMARAGKEAIGKEDMYNSYEKFKEALEKWKDLSPEQRDLKKLGEAGYERAKHRYEDKEFSPAESILETNAIPKFKKLGDDRGVCKSLLLLAKVKVALKKAHEVEEILEKAYKLADEMGDEGFKKEIDEYRAELKSQNVDTTKNPFSEPDSLYDEVRIALKPKYGQARESRPLPQSFDNHHFWRPVDLETGLDKDNKPKNNKKLPFPQPLQYFLIWNQKDVKIAKDESGTGGRIFKPGKFKATRERVTLQYWNPEKDKIVPMMYEFLAIENAKCSIAGSERTFPSNPNYLGLRLHSNTYRIGKIGKHPLAVYDDNTNAIFYDQGTRETGNDVNDHKFFGCDTIVAGAGRSAVATLYGGIIQTPDGKYYYIKEADIGGTYLKVQEYKGPTGKVVLKFNGAPKVTPLHFIIGCPVGGERLGFINLGGSRGSVDVPAGSYFFKYAMLCKGSDPNRADRVEVYPGSYPKKIVVEEGKTRVIEFGGPYEVKMNVNVSGDKAELQTYTLEVFGAKGEEYRRFWAKPFCPDFKVKDANGVLVKKGRLRAFTEQDELEPVGKGIGLLETAKHVLFDVIPARHKSPLKAEFYTRHPLLGNIETKGWR